MSLRSVVHEYEVLYSTRVVQKEKRWNDGKLRYYEFNRKIEVHSDDNLLVATEFYPHESKNPITSGAFADGMALMFPSGKLIVEVTGYIGVFERDVTIKKEAPHKPEVNVQKELHELLYALGDHRYSLRLTKSSLGLTGLPTRKCLSPKASGGISKTAVYKPVGLRKVKASKSPHKVVCDLEAELEAFDFQLKKRDTRVPPGSNKLSIRLLNELGLRQPSLHPH